MENYDWCSISTFCDDVELQTHFNTNPQYYFGDSNPENFEDLSDPKLHLDLPELSFNPDKTNFTNSQSIIGNEAEFGRYYRILIETAYAHKQSFNTIRHHFWLRSFFVSKSKDLYVGFPWYDSNSDTSRMYKWIMSGSEGESYFDGDQGWLLHGIIKGPNIHFLETDDSNFYNPIEGEVFCNASFNLDQFRQKVRESQNTVQSLIADLTKEIGVDVWSKYHDVENLKFGTASWKPNNPSRLKNLVGKLLSKR